MDGRVAEALELMASADADPLMVAQACEVVKSFADARLVDAIGQVYAETPSSIDPCGELVDPNAAEIAAALCWSPGTARHRAEVAQELLFAVPGVHAALACGRIDWGRACEITRGTAELEPGLRARLAEQAVDYAQDHTRGQVRAWLARRLAAIDPEAAQRRRKKACKKRRVWIQPEADGMATIGAYLSAEQAQACFEAICAGVANHEGGVDDARADQFVALLTGLQIGAPVPVQVLLLPTGPELAGYGPLAPDHAASLCEQAARIELNPPSMTIGYRPGLRLARWVRARDRHCRFPGCRRAAAQCDLDHVIPYPAGSTSEQNLAALCRYHHRLKTHTGWTVTPRADHRLDWTSPRGHTYTTGTDDP